MGRLCVLGESVRVEGYALAGATLLIAEDPVEVRRSLDSLPDDVSVLVLTAAAAAALAGELPTSEGLLCAVMPP